MGGGYLNFNSVGGEGAEGEEMEVPVGDAQTLTHVFGKNSTSYILFPVC